MRTCSALALTAIFLSPAVAAAQPLLVVVDPAASDPALDEDARAAADALAEAARESEDYRYADVDVSEAAALELVNCTRPTLACLRAVAASFEADALVTGRVIVADGAPSIVLRSIVDDEPGRSEIMELPLDVERLVNWLAFELRRGPGVEDRQEDGAGRGWKNPVGVSLLAAASGLLTSTFAFGVLIGDINDDARYQEYRTLVGSGLEARGASDAEIASANACEYAEAGETFGGDPSLVSHAQSLCSQGSAFVVAELVTLVLGIASGVAGAVTLLAAFHDESDVAVAFDVTPNHARVNARVAF